MFTKITDVPDPILPFYYEEVRNEPTGKEVEEEYRYVDHNGTPTIGVRSVPEYVDNTYVVLKERGETQDSVADVLKRKAEEALVNVFLGIANNGVDWDFHDNYLDWFLIKPDENDEKYLIKDQDDVLIHSYEDDLNYWKSKEPVKAAYKVLTDYCEYDLWAKLQGVMFEGKRCSATKEDMWGLASISPIVKAGTSINFEFDSGDTLTLTPDNIGEFEKVWIPFRMQFF